MLLPLIFTLYTAALQSSAHEAKSTQAATDLSTLSAILKQYKAITGTYPTSEQGLESLTTKPTLKPIPGKWNQLSKGIRRDPWGRAYFYQNNDGEISLWSKGQDVNDPHDDVKHTLNQ